MIVHVKAKFLVRFVQQLLTFLNIQNNCEKPLSKAFFLICRTSSGDGQKGGHAGKGNSIFIGGVESKGRGKYPAEQGGFSCFGAWKGRPSLPPCQWNTLQKCQKSSLQD